MATSTFTFPAHITEPIDSSRLVTKLSRSSLDDLRAQAASSSVSLTGVYVRSRATSPANSQECVNMAFHPDGDFTEILPPRTTWNFASFAGMDSAPSVASDSATAHAYSGVVDARVEWQYQETTGPPPGYTLESDDEDEIVYMQDARRARNGLKRLVAQLEQQRPSTAPSPSVPSPINLDRAESASASGNSASRPNSTVTFAPIRPAKRTSSLRAVSLRRTRRVMDLKEATHINNAHCLATDTAAPVPDGEGGNAIVFDNDDVGDEAAAPLPKRPNAVYKFIQKKFGFRNVQHATAPESTPVTAFAAPAPQPRPETPRPAATSLFSRHRASPARPTSAQSLRPSVASTATKEKKVLVKKSRALSLLARAPKASPTETTLRTSSERAVEHRATRRRSASFSGFAHVVKPDWELPADLDSELVREALLLSKQTAQDWIYMPQSTDSKGGESSGKYVIRRRGAE
ncbi:hypothetical protein BJ912DRAFT_1113196 [Pholiota molesta]|nr:hypothetical protein BJ912DRAFT_1113196 [Pholiota molesta]